MKRSDEEIKAMIKTCQDLRAVIPQHNYFGKDNHRALDISIEKLGKCLAMTEYQIEDSINAILDAMDPDEAMESPTLQAYDWVLGNTDAEPASKEDVQMFKTEKKRLEGKK